MAILEVSVGIGSVAILGVGRYSVSGNIGGRCRYRVCGNIGGR